MYNSFKEAKTMLNGRQTKKLANNTYARLEGGNIKVRLHNTDIITFTPRKIILNSGGWNTSTTKDRINCFSPALMSQKNSIWYIHHLENNGSTPVFYDGIELKYSGIPFKKCLVYGAKHKKEVLKLKKLVSEYIKAMKEEFETNGIPNPSSGDCWICNFPSDSTCLMSHLEEKYIHGTLINTALIWRGYQNPSYIVSRKLYDFIYRAIRGYFYRHLGVA